MTDYRPCATAPPCEVPLKRRITIHEIIKSVNIITDFIILFFKSIVYPIPLISKNLSIGKLPDASDHATLADRQAKKTYEISRK